MPGHSGNDFFEFKANKLDITEIEGMDNLLSSSSVILDAENEIARVYGISIFEINDNVLTEGVVGYFFNPIAVVGDTFFSAFVQHNSPQGYPGYVVLEGTQSFGAEVVRPEAIIRLIEDVSA